MKLVVSMLYESSEARLKPIHSEETVNITLVNKPPVPAPWNLRLDGVAPWTSGWMLRNWTQPCKNNSRSRKRKMNSALGYRHASD